MDEQTQFYYTLYPYVREAMFLEGIDPAWAPIVTNQNMIETSWGESPLVQYNNFFGMKAGEKQNGVMMNTKEGYGKNTVRIKDKFLKFPTAKEGVLEGVKRLRDKFHAFEGTPSEEQYIKNINANPTQVYFTGDPQAYLNNLKAISKGKRARAAIQQYEKDKALQKEKDMKNVLDRISVEHADALRVNRPEIVWPTPYERPPLPSVEDNFWSTFATLPYKADGGSINQSARKSWNTLSAAEKADIMKMAISNGIYNLEDIKGIYKEFAEGGKIHIDPSKKGTFTAAASKHGKSVQEFASQVLAHPENYSPAMRKKANFARNASHWHGNGGHLYEDGNLLLKSKYSPGGIRVPYAFKELTRLSFMPNPQPELDYYAYWLDHRRKQLEQNMKDTGTYPKTSYIDTLKNWGKGYEDGRIALNREIYKQLNNAANVLVDYDSKNLPELEENTEGLYQKSSERILLKPDMPRGHEKSTILHELTHAANQPKLIAGYYAEDSAVSPQEKKIKQLGIKAHHNFTEEDKKEWPTLYQYMEDQIRYLSFPSEIYARIMQFRKENNLDPSHVYTVDEIKPLFNSSKVDGIDYYNLEDFVKALNEVAYNSSSEDSNKKHYAKHGGHLYGMGSHGNRSIGLKLLDLI